MASPEPSPDLEPNQVLRLLLSHARSTRLARCWRWLIGCCCRHASLLAFVAAVPSPVRVRVRVRGRGRVRVRVRVRVKG